MTTHAHIRLLLYIAALAAALIWTGRHNALLDAELAQLEAEQVSLVAEQADLRATLTDLSRRIEIVQAALGGECHPTIRDAIRLAWESSSQRVPLEVFERLVWVESRCIPWAVSPAGATGLGQIRPSTADKSQDELVDPAVNLSASIAYLDALLTRYGGDLRAALTSYAWGPTRYDNGITTTEYARRLMGE